MTYFGHVVMNFMTSHNHVIVNIINLGYMTKYVITWLKFNYSHKNVQVMDVAFWCDG
jgi:hypothetical protein